MNHSTPGLPVHTNSQSLSKLMSIESVMPSNHLILCRPLFLLPSIFPNIRVFSNESALHMRWPKYWHFSFNISPSNEHPGLISFIYLFIIYLFFNFYSILLYNTVLVLPYIDMNPQTDWIFLQSKGLSRVFSNTTVQKHQFFGA